MGDGDGMTGKDDRGRLVIDFGDAGGADTPGEPAAADGDPRFGEVLGGCRLDAVVGRGGMGITYRAFQLQEQRTVAVKVVRPELAANPEFRARFQEEIRSAAAVDHRHAVTVHFSGSDAGRLFVVMQYIDGIDLRARLERGPLTAEPAARIAEHIGGALAAAHASGVVHRDVKPENILIAGKGDRRDAFLTDFGIARAVSSPRLTRSGSWVGTILYAAPEQIHGD
ncbi:MAG TPA: serine/threonine-protein kinase, partial [Solirubrobacteraceae bacterium]